LITNIAVFAGGVTAIHSISKPHPNYFYEETQQKIEHFYKSGTKPMTCQAIAETFINSEMKVKFGFKQVELKRLIAFNKEMHQEHFVSHTSKVGSTGEDLPQSYGD
jgi:hypothetical protein